MQENLILQLNNVTKYFPLGSGFFHHNTSAEIKAVDGVSLEIKKGETLGLVGESGCGKTTLGRCVLQLYRPTSGEIIYKDQDLCKLSENELRPIRRKIQLIFQDPYDSLNPRFTASEIIGEPLVIQGIKGENGYRDRIIEMMQTVGLSPNMAERYPHEFSGGQRQRLGVARALILNPDFIVCDEPLSALDVSIQAQIVNLLEELQEKYNIAYLFISHDLSVVRHISDRVAVMYLGKIMELADCDELYQKPLHPYTQALLSAVPQPDPSIEEKRSVIMLHGEVPSPINPPKGCVFHPRCPKVLKECSRVVPQLKRIDSGHQVACLLYQQSWPEGKFDKVE